MDRTRARSRPSRSSGRWGRWAFGLSFALIAVFSILTWPRVQPGVIPGPAPDAPSYAYMAAGLTHGTLLVDYDGPPHLTRYTPGFALMLVPAVALGGVEAAVWVPYVLAVLLGVLVLFLTAALGGPGAGLLAVMFTLFSGYALLGAQMVMSDLPSATLSVLEILALAFARSRWTAVAAGFIGGALVWIRPVSLVLAVAAVVALTACKDFRGRARWYSIGLAVPVALLAMWQWSTFGSPFTTSYVGADAGPGDGSGFAGLYGLKYLFGPPWNAYSAGIDPNVSVYPKWLIGLDSDTYLPGVGLVGLLGAVQMARSARRPVAVFGCFTVGATLLTLAVYLPYFFRAERFLVTPAVLTTVAAAVLIARIATLLRVRLRGAAAPDAR